MSVINALPAMPNRMAIACEYLFMLGSEGAPKEEILTQLSPLSKDEGGETAGSGPTMASSVITEMESLQLVCFNAKGHLCLAEDLLVAGNEGLSWQSVLRPVLRERLTDPHRAAEFKQEEVADALSWLLAQDPFRPFAKARQHADLLREQLDESDILLTTIGNDSRFQNLLYWARYVGFAEWIGSGGNDLILPDPTRAVQEYLPSVFGDNTMLPIGEFAGRLAKTCSIFEGGVSRQAFEKRLRISFREHHHFARSTSLCLARLENRGVISIVKEADAETWILDLGREQRPVTSLDYPPRARV